MARLFSHFDTMEAAWNADASELIKAGIKPKLATSFAHLRSNTNPEALHAILIRNEVTTVTIADEEYPPLLKTIHDPPAVLYIKGKLPSAHLPHVGIVGSRKATTYGIEAAKALTRELVESKAVIVSGLAYGIDETAHIETLNNSGKTIAVLGYGILYKGTGRSRYIADKIIERGGAVISEFPMNAPGLKQNFPYRNRVIAGISQGTLIIEATKKSGSLITARAALDQNRDVFAVPGPITSKNSEGTNNLLKMGATPVTEAADILNILKVEQIKTETKKIVPDSQEEATILDFLSKAPIHIDEITQESHLDPASVSSTLSLMEMKGRARHIGGMYYVRT